MALLPVVMHVLLDAYLPLVYEDVPGVHEWL